MNKKPKIYIISDIHGHYYTFLQLLKRIKILHKQKTDEIYIYLVGDLIDRGRYSFQVVEFVKNQEHRENKNFNDEYPIIKTVMGNHEDLFLDAIELLLNNQSLYNYKDYFSLGIGGFSTMLSGYFKKGINLHKNQFDINDFDYQKLIDHYNWIKTLPYYIETTYVDDNRTLFVSHSSISGVYQFKNSIKEEEVKNFKNNVLWNREKPKDIQNIYNVYGHTPQLYPIITDAFANIDRGVYVNEFQHQGYSELIAIDFFTKKILRQKALMKDRR